VHGGPAHRRTAFLPYSPRATRHARTSRPHRPAPPGLWRRRRTLGVLRPIPRPAVLASKVTPLPLFAYKSWPPSPRAQGALAEPTPAPWTPMRSSTFRQLSPPNHVAPTSTRTPCSSHTRLLSRPGRRLAGIKPPAAATAGLRRACPPATSLPLVSTQTGPRQPLEPP
jgi:hypothetical protein